MSHHYAGPNFGFPHGDARLNLTDLYAFPKPGGDRKSIIVIDVHPSHTFDPQAPTTPVPFASEALYELKIDTNGDAIADVAYRVRFSPFTGGTQTATLRRAEGAQAADAGDDGEVIVAGAPVSLDREARVTEAGDYRFFAGWRSDPFFFDPLGAVNNHHFTGEDFFTDKNVCSIVLEVPNAAIGPKEVGLWMRTLDGAGGSWVQADRGAGPSQGVFLVGEEQGAYLATEPADDARFIAVFAYSLEHSGGYTADEAQRVTKSLLPDILPYDPKRPAAYPTNGRALTDDVMAVFLPILWKGEDRRSRGPSRSAHRVSAPGTAAQIDAPGPRHRSPQLPNEFMRTRPNPPMGSAGSPQGTFRRVACFAVEPVSVRGTSVGARTCSRQRHQKSIRLPRRPVEKRSITIRASASGACLRGWARGRLEFARCGGGEWRTGRV
jgi:hypothetical protein